MLQTPHAAAPSVHREAAPQSLSDETLSAAEFVESFAKDCLARSAGGGLGGVFNDILPHLLPESCTDSKILLTAKSAVSTG